MHLYMLYIMPRHNIQLLLYYCLYLLGRFKRLWWIIYIFCTRRKVKSKSCLITFWFYFIFFDISFSFNSFNFIIQSNSLQIQCVVNIQRNGPLMLQNIVNIQRNNIAESNRDKKKKAINKEILHIICHFINL